MSIKGYCDGACRGNPGPSSCAYVIYDHDGQELDSGYKYLGTVTNNVAEYHGLLELLHALTLWVKGATIYCDSKLVVNQVTEKWQVKHEYMKPLYALAKGLMILGGHSIEHIDGHSGIRGNERADELCNECLDQYEAETNA